VPSAGRDTSADARGSHVDLDGIALARDPYRTIRSHEPGHHELLARTRRQGPRVRGRADAVFATRGADDASDLNAVVPVGRGALLFLWRGYADPAARTRPAPCSDAATGLLAETLSAPLLASSATGTVLGRDAAATVDLE